MSADPAHRPQLGELLVHKGTLTDAQLQLALAEQQRSGAPLGEILVRLGFAKGPTIANALAEQHGGPLRTEYGLSIGPARPVGTPPDPTRNLQPVPDTSAHEAELARLTEALNEKTAALARVHLDLASAAGQVAAATSELEQTKRELRAALEAQVEPEPEPEPETEHLLFLPGPSGYVVLERPGPPPAAGDAVAVEDAFYTVLKVGSSPLPGRPVRCAFLAGRLAGE
jgi:hypothetical protein